MSSNVIDYFAVLGKSDGALVCKNVALSWEEPKQTLAPRDLWMAAITDIALIFADKGEVLPDDTWEIIHDTVGGSPANLNSGDLARGLAHIAIRRRAMSKRLDHIVEISLLPRGRPIPEGFEILQTSISGQFPADINTAATASVFVFRRSKGEPREYFCGTKFIDDICVVIDKYEEEVPDDYLALDKLINDGPPHGDIVQVAYRYCVPLGLCDLKYEAVALDRYPQADHPDRELPMKELPLFVFPHDMTLETSPSGTYPLPDFFTMVFTTGKGDYMYCACLRFFEILDDKAIQDCCESIYGDSMRGNVSEMNLGFKVFCPKVICVISSHPFYRGMRRYLRQLYSLSISATMCPIEYFISSFVSKVPLPIEGGRPFHIHLDAALITSSSRAMTPIQFDLPPSRFFPHMDLDFAGPLRCLSVEKVIAVFTLMLQEAKILFLGQSNALVTEVMETLRSLLFPMTWSSCFVSRLPDALYGLLQALGGFMIGVHIPQSEQSSTSRKEFMKIYLKQSHLASSLQSGTYVVDLSDNEIYRFTTSNNSEILNAAALTSLTKSLPVGPRKRLTTRLQNIATQYRIGPQTSGLEIFDSAFEFHLADATDVSSAKWAKFPTLDIRDAFMVFLIDILGDYTKYIIPPPQDLSSDVYRTFKEEFSVAEYLNDSDRASRPVIEALLETQMFAVLLQQRRENCEFSLLFYENAADLLREFGLSAGGHNKSVGGWTLSKGLDLPAPLYKLLGQRRYTSLLEAQFQDVGDTSKYRTGGALERALGRLSALESMKSSSSDDEEDEDEEGQFGVSRRMSSTSVDTRDSETKDIFEIPDNLNLYDCNYGPLVLPGPVMVDPENPEQAVILTTSNFLSKYSYSSGWPSLNADYLDIAQSIVHPLLKHVIYTRKFALEKADRRLRMISRSPSERLSYRISGRLLREIHHSLPLSKEAKISLGLSSDIACLSLILLGLRVSKKVRPVSDILQICGILAQYESMGILSLIDESVWRNILIGCATCGGDFMRGMSSVVCRAMDEVNVRLDAISYGQYVRSMSALKPQFDIGIGDSHIIDSHVYLEELGSAWFVTRSAIIRESIKSDPKGPTNSSRGSTPESSKSLSPQRRGVLDFFRGRSPPTNQSILPETSSHSSKLTSLISSKLGLCKASGMFSLLVPKGFLLASMIRKLDTDHRVLFNSAPEVANLFQDFDRVHGEISTRYLDSTSSSSLSTLPNPPQKSVYRYFFGKRSPEEELSAIHQSTADLSRISIDDASATELSSMKEKVVAIVEEKDTDIDDSGAEEEDSFEAFDVSMSPSARRSKNKLKSVLKSVQHLLSQDECAVGIHSQTFCRCGYSLLDEEILSMWTGFGQGARVSNPNLLGRYDSLGIVDAHSLKCPQCAALLEPLLHVRCYSKSSASASSLKSVEVDSLSVLWEENVRYLSPFGLRFGIEELIQEMGEKVIDASWIHDKRPDLYWNCKWYFRRGGFPSGFEPLTSRFAGPFDGLILVGWREHTVRASVSNFLNGNPDKPIDLKDLFPGCFDHDVERIERMVQNLETRSHEAVKNAILELMEMPCIIESRTSCTVAARNIYVALFSVLHIYGLSEAPVKESANVLDFKMPRGTHFDILFNEVIDSKLSPEDLFKLETDRVIFKTCTPDSAALAIRVTFGFLL